MKKKLTGKIAALLMLLCVLCMSITASAAPAENDANGKITLSATSAMAGIKVGIYEVGELDPDNQFALYDTYRESGVDLNGLKESSEAEEAATQLAEIALKQEPLQQSAFGEDGQVVFASLSSTEKIYLICQLEAHDHYTLSPILANLPQFLEGQVITDIRIDAKYEYVPPVVPTGSIILNKTDEKGQPLAGAVFNVTKKSYLEGAYMFEGIQTETDSQGVYLWEEIGNLETDQYGQITVVDVPLGTYRFIETKAPAGYLLDATPIYAEVTAGGTIRLQKGMYVADQGEPVILTVQNKPVPVESSVVPTPSSTPELPPEPSVPPVVTGEDIAKFIIIGVVVAVSLVAVILLFVLGRKKKDQSDDDE